MPRRLYPDPAASEQGRPGSDCASRPGSNAIPGDAGRPATPARRPIPTDWNLSVCLDPALHPAANAFIEMLVAKRAHDLHSFLAASGRLRAEGYSAVILSPEARAVALKGGRR